MTPAGKAVSRGPGVEHGVGSSLCALASGGTARLTHALRDTKLGRLSLKQPSAKKIGSVARGPSVHRPGAAMPPAQAPKNAPECKVQ